MALSKPLDIDRHLEFKQDVDELMVYGHIRFYTSEISNKTGEATGNIARYYKGDIPIGDNFFKKFKKAYKKELIRIGREMPNKHSKVVSASEITSPLNQQAESSSSVTKSSPPLAEKEEQYSSPFEKFMIEKITNIEVAIQRLEQKMDDQSKKYPKKK